MTTLMPQRDGIRDGLSVLGRTLALSYFCKLRQIGRLSALVSQRQVLAMFYTKDDALSCLRYALTRFLRQVGCAASTVACIGQSASNEPHILNPEYFSIRPRAIVYFLKHQDARFQSVCFKLAKPMQLMRAMVGRFTQMSVQAAMQALRLANVTKLTRTWVKQAINRTHLGAAI